MKCPCVKDPLEQDCGFPDCCGGWEAVYRQAQEDIQRMRDGIRLIIGTVPSPFAQIEVVAMQPQQLIRHIHELLGDEILNLQPVLDEMREHRINPKMHFPVLKEFYKTHGFEKANATISQHWRNVDRGLTSEYKELKK